MTGDGVLSQLMGGILGGGVRVVDLTMTLQPDVPTIVMPPEFGQSWPFRMEEISKYDHRGPFCYWNNLSCGEHTGTHFDAPIHWVSGKNLPENATDTIPVEKFLAHACVVDCSTEADDDPDFLLTQEFIVFHGVLIDLIFVHCFRYVFIDFLLFSLFFISSMTRSSISYKIRTEKTIVP